MTDEYDVSEGVCIEQTARMCDGVCEWLVKFAGDCFCVDVSRAAELIVLLGLLAVRKELNNTHKQTSLYCSLRTNCATKEMMRYILQFFLGEKVCNEKIWNKVNKLPVYESKTNSTYIFLYPKRLTNESI